MTFWHMTRSSIRAAAWTAALAALLATEARGQPGWRPDKAVEIIVPTAAGGPNDVMMRLMQKILQDQKLVTSPVVVMNKPGGNQTLAPIYVHQHPANPHYLLYSAATIFTNQLSGLTQLRYTDLTPLALFSVDHTAITVLADSPMKNMRHLVERLKADPDSIAFGAGALGGVNHLALFQAMRSAGVDAKKLKVVVFRTSIESMTAMAGGHIQAVLSSVSSAVPQLQAGNTRVLAIASPQREAGAMANVPTLREQGINADGIANWRAMFSAKGLTPPQISFWEDALARVAATNEWENQLRQNNLASQFLRGNDLAKYLEGEYNDTKSVMTELGLVK
mgnify:CR=1 FL=1